MRAAFSDALVSAARRNPDVLLLTGDHGYALFDAFRKECPSQYLNCGVAEQNMVGVAAGLAKGGFRPVVYGLAAFIPVRVLEQIKIDVCYEGLPVIFIGDGAGFVYSQLGSSHQSTEDIACTRAIPGLNVLSPADRFEMSAAFAFAMEQEGSTYIRIGKADRGDVHGGPITITRMQKLRNGSGEGALVATGSMVKTALEIHASGISAEVWSVPSIKPIDITALKEICAGARWMAVLEEHSTRGGLADAVAQALPLNQPPPILRVGVEDRFSALCGDYEYLLQEHKLDKATVMERIAAFADGVTF